LESIEQDVIWAPLNNKLKTPDFLISCTYGSDKKLFVFWDKVEKEVMIFS